MQLEALGHACFVLSHEGHSVIFDPWLAENPEASTAPEDVDVDAILVSHGHSDHLGDAIPIAKRLGAPIIGTYELCMYCQRHGASVEPMHIGGGRQFDFGHVKLTLALHGGGVIEDDHIEYTGPPCGFLVTMGDQTLYYAADTGLFGDMRLIGQHNDLDAAVLPIGDNFTMGPEDAFRAAEMLEVPVVVPMHFSAFEVIQQDVVAFAAGLDELGIRPLVLHPGDKGEIA
ncbi:MAG: metal-dependent hydrolase [Armatimonadota bacterium]